MMFAIWSGLSKTAALRSKWHHRGANCQINLAKSQVYFSLADAAADAPPLMSVPMSADVALRVAESICISNPNKRQPSCPTDAPPPARCSARHARMAEPQARPPDEGDPR